MILILKKFKGNAETIEGTVDEFEAGTTCGQSFIRTYIKGLEYLIKCTEKDVFAINEFKASRHKYFVNLEISRHMLSFENVYELENFSFIQKTNKDLSRRPPQAKTQPQYIQEERGDPFIRVSEHKLARQSELEKNGWVGGYYSENSEYESDK
jgi:hypothetical protein